VIMASWPYQKTSKVAGLEPENGPLQSGWVIVEKYASQVVKCKKSWKKCKDLRLIIPTLVS
jgi:hypothetical protein